MANHHHRPANPASASSGTWAFVLAMGWLAGCTTARSAPVEPEVPPLDAHAVTPDGGMALTEGARPDAPAAAPEGPSDAAPPPGVLTCRSGEQICSGACADPASDPHHCGGCGKACTAGQVCLGGQCATDCGTKSKCDGACVDLMTDLGHCGSCDKACPAAGKGTAACVAGRCKPACTGGAVCGEVCPDYDRDPLDCGGCGRSCAAGQPCLGGACCAQSNCGGVCADTASDSKNCGACGRVCAGGQVCLSGQCTVDCGSKTKCGGACVDLMTDAGHCGSCDKACASPGKGTAACAAGKCKPACDPGIAACGELCPDYARDPLNCGACGRACAAGQSCLSGVCCAIGQTNCGGTCVDTAGDRKNCGACNHACLDPGGGGSVSCVGGQCSVSCGASPPCGMTCCPAGTLCSGGQCAACGKAGQPCCPGNSCSAGTCLGAVCKVASCDGKTCGTSDGAGGVCTACPSDKSCNGVACVCSGGLTDCGRCLDISRDVANCGGCGVTCAQPNTNATCSGGHCSYTCPGGGPPLCGGNDHPHCLHWDFETTGSGSLEGWQVDTGSTGVIQDSDLSVATPPTPLSGKALAVTVRFGESGGSFNLKAPTGCTGSIDLLRQRIRFRYMAVGVNAGESAKLGDSCGCAAIAWGNTHDNSSFHNPDDDTCFQGGLCDGAGTWKTFTGSATSGPATDIGVSFKMKPTAGGWAGTVYFDQIEVGSTVSVNDPAPAFVCSLNGCP
jgi:hypothetical protein